MWKTWRKEIIGISVAAMVLIGVIAGFTLKMQEATRQAVAYKQHLVLEETTYWHSTEYPGAELPEGFAEIDRVKTELTHGGPARKSGEAWGVKTGTPIYGSEEYPGQVYISEENGRWIRFLTRELGQIFLRYNGKLYLSEFYIFDTGEWLTIPYRVKDFSPTGETISYPGDWEVIPKENCTTNDSSYSGSEILLNPKQPEVLLVKHTFMRKGEPEVNDTPFVTVDSIGLDYSAYE